MKRTIVISVLALLAFSSCSDVVKNAQTAVEISKEIGKSLSEDEEIDMSNSSNDKDSSEDGSNTTTKKSVLKGKERLALDSLVCKINNVKSDPDAIYEEEETVTWIGETSSDSKTKYFRNGTLVKSIHTENGDAWYISIFEKQYYLDGRIYRKTLSRSEGLFSKVKDNIYNRNGNLIVSMFAKTKSESEDFEDVHDLNYFLIKQKKNDDVVYSKVYNDTLLIGCDEIYKNPKEVYLLVDKDGDTPMSDKIKELQSLIYHIDKSFVKEVKRIK